MYNTRITKCLAFYAYGRFKMTSIEYVWIDQTNPESETRYDELGLLIGFGLLTTLRQTKPRYDQGCNVRSNVECSACPAFHTD